MYLVELKPGREELYRTSDELAIAIRDGDVDSRSRIYHRATAKWISITLHPQYKAIVAEEEQPARPARKAWGLLPTALGGIPVELTSTDAPASQGAVRQRWKRPIGLGLAGVMLLLGIQLASSGPRPPWAGGGKAVAIAAPTSEPEAPVTREEPVPTSPGSYDAVEMASLASTHAAWPVPSLPAGDSAIAPLPVDEVAPALPRAPRLRPKALRAALASNVTRKRAVKANSVQALLRRYDSASEQAREKLEGGLRVARLHRLFAPARLAPGGGVTDTRLNLAGAANFIRVYRRQQEAIDRAYQDSVAVLAKRHKWSRNQVRQWYSRPARKENPTLVLLSGSLLSGIDSLLGVLDSHAGAYKVRGTAIAFEDPAATQAYGVLRRQIKEQIEAAVAAGGATEPGPTGLLLQAIGTSTLPRET